MVWFGQFDQFHTKNVNVGGDLEKNVYFECSYWEIEFGSLSFLRKSMISSKHFRAARAFFARLLQKSMRNMHGCDLAENGDFDEGTFVNMVAKMERTVS